MRPKILREKTVYSKINLSVIESTLQFGTNKPVVWNYVSAPNGVGVLPIDKDNNVYLVREWRLAWKRYILEVPAGIFLGKTEKERVAQVRAELREEIGFDAKKLVKLGDYYSTSRIAHSPHMYIATGLYPFKQEKDEPHEYIEIVKMPFDKAYNTFVSGKEKTTAYTLMAFLLARLKHGY